jgi:hypothetical protein
VTVDGRVYDSQPIQIIATRSETGDLVFAAVEADRESIYLGEPVELTLRLWIKSYQDREFGVALNNAAMWRQIEDRLSQFGPFTSYLQDLASRMQQPRGETVIRDDSRGTPRSYYLYELPATFWPRSTGPVSLDPVRLTISYPTALGRSRSPFSFNDLMISQTRPVSVEASQPVIEVKPLPEEGRPPYFAGAVGEFDIATSALPVSAAVGDPITLTMQIHDRTGGRWHADRLDLLQAPLLDRVPTLTEAFRIPPDPLAGVVEGRAKTFTQTIRPRHDRISQIPAIPFAYFDPRKEQYVTVVSEAIPITITPGSTLAMSEVVESAAAAPRPGGTNGTELTEVAGGILANYGLHDGVLASHSLNPGWGAAAVIAVPPAVFAVVTLISRRARRLRTDVRYARRRGARRRADQRLRTALTLSDREQADAVAAAVAGYIADRRHLPPGALTRLEVIEQLQRAGVDGEVRGGIEALLDDCELQRYGGGAADGRAGDGPGLVDRARACLARLERERLA